MALEELKVTDLDELEVHRQNVRMVMQDLVRLEHQAKHDSVDELFNQAI